MSLKGHMQCEQVIYGYMSLKGHIQHTLCVYMYVTKGQTCSVSNLCYVCDWGVYIFSEVVHVSCIVSQKS